MNRRNLFQGLVAMVMGQNPVGAPVCGSPGEKSCDEVYRKPLKEGEERCPIGHVQKPLIAGFLAVGDLNGNKFDGYPIAVLPSRELHVCSTCGIVYCQQKDVAPQAK